jgi:hypothetical protein
MHHCAVSHGSGPVIPKEWRKASEPSKNGVLISKRDRLYRIQRQFLKTVRETPPTTFLFLLIFNCQITDHKAKTRSRQTPTEPNRNPAPKSANPPISTECLKRFLKTPERRTSSLAAPPPSSVSGLIDPHPPKRQQTKITKTGKSRKVLI